MSDIVLPENCLGYLRDTRLRRLCGYWREKCAGRPMPPKAAIDPVDFPYILGYASLVEVELSPRRYRFRLDGSILVRLSGVDYTGRYLDELGMPTYIGFITASYDRVTDSGQPYAYRKGGDFDHKSFDEETLVLPLGDGVVRCLLVAVIPGELAPQTEKRVI